MEFQALTTSENPELETLPSEPCSFFVTEEKLVEIPGRDIQCTTMRSGGTGVPPDLCPFDVGTGGKCTKLVCFIKEHGRQNVNKVETARSQNQAHAHRNFSQSGHRLHPKGSTR